MLQAALKALEQMLGMGRSAAGVAALLHNVPLPDDEVCRDAKMPLTQGRPPGPLSFAFATMGGLAATTG